MLKRIYYFHKFVNTDAFYLWIFFFYKYASFFKIDLILQTGQLLWNRGIICERNIRIPSLAFSILLISAHYAMDNPDLMPKKLEFQGVSAEVNSFPSFSNAFFSNIYTLFILCTLAIVLKLVLSLVFSPFVEWVCGHCRKWVRTCLYPAM